MSSVKSIQLPSWDRWVLIEQIFHRARTTENLAARAEVLRELCAGDPQLFADVEALLIADGMANAACRNVQQRASHSLTGRRVGNYQLDGLLGSGGMGSVYLAHRCDGQFDRQVALKVLGANLRNEFFTDRFAVERQLLAGLQHPNIAGLLDSGVGDGGDPYLVLEYVDGTLIDQYCDDRRLPVDSRIRLFLQVCLAVEFAHSRHIIHRDLKPSNILVARDGSVKLLDFGTARLLDIADSTNPAPASTRFRMMTPRYASPEQLRGDPMGPSSDIFSLGIVLYELLTGAWPFGESQSVVAALERAVREVEPRHPKTVVDVAMASKRGGVTREALVQRLSGDVWNVVLKAIHAAPERRYRSVYELTLDLQRYLDGDPVLAKRQALIHRAATFIRRNRSGAGIALALLVTAVGMVFLRPHQGPAGTIAVLPFENLSADPGSQYFSDGLTDEITSSITHIKPLLVISRASSFQFRHRSEDLRTVGKRLNATHILEGSVAREGNHVKVVARLESSSDGSQVWSHVYVRQTSDLLSLQTELASDIASSLHASFVRGSRAKHVVSNQEAVDAFMRGRHEAEQFTTASLEKAVALFRKVIALDPEYADAYAALGGTLLNKAPFDHVDYRKADYLKVLDVTLSYYRKALQLDPDLVGVRSNMAILTLTEDWDWKRAENEYRRALLNGPNAVANTNYGLMLVNQGRFAEADEHLRLAQTQNPYSTAQMINLSLARTLERRYTDSIRISESLLSRFPQMRSPRNDIDWNYVLEGKPALALTDYDRFPEAGPKEQMNRALALSRMGRKDEALALIHPLEADSKRFPASAFAAVYAHLGDAKAIEWCKSPLRCTSIHCFTSG